MRLASHAAALAFAFTLALAGWTNIPAAAIVTEPFAADTFAAAQAAGKPVVIHVSAPWCPTCKAQQQVLKSIEAKPEFANVTLLKVDFDSEKDVLKKFRVTGQSTLIAFKGTTETGRSIGDTQPDSIEALIASTVK